jgi:hypothetical protein
VQICFQAWLLQRGTTGDQEIEAGIRQVRACIEAYGDSRFFAAWENNPERVLTRAGCRKYTSWCRCEPKSCIWRHWATPSGPRSAAVSESEKLSFSKFNQASDTGDTDAPMRYSER